MVNPPRGLHLDPFSGMAGDMFLAALIDLGLPLDELRRRLATLPFGDFTLEVETVMRGAIRATKLDVLIRKADGRVVREGREQPHQPHGAAEGGPGTPRTASVPDQAHGHGHGHGQGHDHDHGASYREILGIIAAWPESDRVRERAAAIFRTLADAEARVHGMAVEDVRFHEVGAVDSIVDICGAAVAIDILGIDRITSERPGIGRGVRRMAHGAVPVPAPATAEIIVGMPVRHAGVEDELLTPTGAAILRCLVDEFEPTAAMRTRAVGWGAGSTDRADPPNVVRAMLYDDESAGSTPAAVTIVETRVDDMTPEALAFLRERLEELGGVLDVAVTAVTMKKGRPGWSISVVAEPAAAGATEEVLFRHSTTFGVRRRTEQRSLLEREVVEVVTPWGAVRVKLGRRGGKVVRATPEYEDCARLARENDVPLDLVFAAARNAPGA